MIEQSLTVEAVFEDGIFRPMTPVQLTDHQRVRITVNKVRVPREWPADTAENYRELVEEDRRMAANSQCAIREMWLGQQGE